VRANVSAEPDVINLFETVDRNPRWGSSCGGKPGLNALFPFEEEELEVELEVARRSEWFQ
jgi:hypothetical protein